MSPQVRAGIVLAAGSVLVLVSGAVLLLIPRSQAAFGWFAYAPLTDTAFTQYFRYLEPTHRWAVVVGIAGLAAASCAAGFLAGRRRT